MSLCVLVETNHSYQCPTTKNSQNDDQTWRRLMAFPLVCRVGQMTDERACFACRCVSGLNSVETHTATRVQLLRIQRTTTKLGAVQWRSRWRVALIKGPTRGRASRVAVRLG